MHLSSLNECVGVVVEIVCCLAVSVRHPSYQNDRMKDRPIDAIDGPLIID